MRGRVYKGEYMKKYLIWASTVAALCSTLLVLTYTAPAHATDCLTLPDTTAGANGQMQAFFTSTLSRDGNKGTATITRKGSTPLCHDQPMVFQSFNMGPNWNGQPDSSSSLETSYTQTMAYVTSFTFGKNETSKTVTVQTPEACKGTQIDVYVGSQSLTKLDKINDDGPRIIAGKIFTANGKPCETPKVSVCTKGSGDTTMQTIEESAYDSSTQSKNADDCKKPETPTQPTEPTTPSTDTGNVATTPTQTATELPHTGPTGIFGGLIGIGSLSYSTYAYLASRRARHNA